MGPRGTGLVNDAVCIGTGTGTAAGTGAGNDTGGPGSGGSGWLGWVAWCGWAGWTGWTGWIAAGGPSWVVRGGSLCAGADWVLGPGMDCVLESWLLRGGSIVHRRVRVRVRGGVRVCGVCGRGRGRSGGGVRAGLPCVLFIVVGAAKSQSQCECERERERGAGGGVVAPDDATCASSESPPATARGEKREARGLPFVLLYLRSGSDCWRHAHALGSASRRLLARCRGHRDEAG